MPPNREGKGSPFTPEQLKEGVMEVKVTGTTDSVKEKLGMDREAPPANGNGDKDDFVTALRDPRHTVVVKRIMPRIWEGQRANFEVYREQCPLDLSSIEEDVFSQHGGKRFRVAVIDPEGNRTISARIIENDAPPILPDMEDDEAIKKLLMAPTQKTVGQISEEMLDRQAKITAKQLEVEQLTSQLEAVRAGRGGGKKDPQADARITELEKKLTETKHEAELAKVRLESDAKVAALSKQVEGLSQLIQQKPARGEGGLDSQTLLLQFMKDSNSRFDSMLAAMRDDKLTAIQRELSQIKNTPQKESGGMLELAETMLRLRKVFGWQGGGDDDEDEDGEDERPWYEKLADRYLPRLFDVISQEKKDGKPEPTKEELIARINAEADRAVQEEMKRRRALAPPAAPPPLPAPSADAPGPMAVPPVPVAAPPEPERKIPSLEEEIKLRAGQFMSVLEREIVMRPREWNWTVVAWGGLPESILEKLVVAPNAAALVAAFDGMLNPTGLEALKAKLVAEPKMALWVERGMKELREWWAKSQADPDFDPLAEDETGAEQEE